LYGGGEPPVWSSAELVRLGTFAAANDESEVAFEALMTDLPGRLRADVLGRMERLERPSWSPFQHLWLLRALAIPNISPHCAWAAAAARVGHSLAETERHIVAGGLLDVTLWDEQICQMMLSLEGGGPTLADCAEALKIIGDSLRELFEPNPPLPTPRDLQERANVLIARARTRCPWTPEELEQLRVLTRVSDWHVQDVSDQLGHRPLEVALEVTARQTEWIMNMQEARRAIRMEKPVEG
jgi:hypothetical protein